MEVPFISKREWLSRTWDFTVGIIVCFNNTWLKLATCGCNVLAGGINMPVGNQRYF